MTAHNAVAELGVAEAEPAAFSMPAAGATFSLFGGSTGTTPSADGATFNLFPVSAGGVFSYDAAEPTQTGAVAEFGVAEFPSAFGSNLIASGASFSLTGQDALFLRAELAEAAAFSLTGQAAGIGGPAEAASFSLSGQDVLFGAYLGCDAATFSLTVVDAQQAWASAGATFTFTGQDAVSIFGIVAGVGAFNFFGNNTALSADYTGAIATGQGAVAEFAVAEGLPEEIFGLYAAAATFNVTGQGLLFSARGLSETGAFSLSGGPADLAFAHPPASFALTGNDIILQTYLDADPGEFIVSGGTAEIAFQHPPAAFAFSGIDLNFVAALDADPASYELAINAPFVGIRADAAAFVLTGNESVIPLVFNAEAGTFTFTGQDANLLNIFRFYVDPASFTFTGQDAGRAYTLGAETGEFTLAGFATFATQAVAEAAAFTLTGQTALYRAAINANTGVFTLLGWTVTDAVGPTGDHIFLIEVQGHNGSTLETFYVATSGFTSAPYDTPANQFYEPRIVDPGNFERSLFSGGETRGRSSVGAGDIILANADPGDGTTLDNWLDYGWDGRQITIKALPTGAKTLAAASTLFRGRLNKLTATRPLDAISLQIADRLSDLDKPLLTTLFAGTTTSTAATAEGNADLKGKVKQRAYGEVFEAPLQPANPYDLIYLASDNGFQSITVYDGGVALTGDGDDADIATLRAASIAAGHYRTCKADGLVRLGGTPVYALTADVVEGATSADRTAAQIAKRMLLDFGIPSDEIITGAFSALDTKNNAVVGILIDDERTALDAASEVLDSIGGWLVPSRDGSFETNRFEEPDPGPALTFDIEDQAIGESLDRIDGEIPVYRVTLKYRRVETVQNDSQLAGSVDATRRAYVGEQWRSVVAEDASVKTKHLNAREITIETCLTTQADAQDEADRLLDLYKVERSRYEIAVPLSDGWAGDVGLALTLTHPTRLGMSGGKAFTIIGRSDEYASEKVRFQIWG